MGLKMFITDEMIHPDIRRTGSFIRKVFNFSSEKIFVNCQKVMPIARRFMKAKNMRHLKRII